MKNQEMEIPTDLHDEDRIRRSNVVFLKPVSDINMKNQEMEIPTDLHDEDRICRSNVVFLKPVSDISKGESMSVKQGATVNLTTELDISGSSVLHPDDFITLKNGKPIEFNEKETPILTINDNLINLVLEEISPEQGGIYEIGLRQPTKCLLKSGENEDETLDEPTSSSVIPFARFPLICPESSTDFVVWQTGNWIALTIPNVRSDLTGTYTLTVDTPRGRYTTTSDLSVNGQKRQTTPYVPS
ncbi:unnamed protein product [Trichobilharzia regenti]|nr:unnamed protein product [Trichobilharzia regenti]